MTVSDEIRLEVLHDHYKDSFNLIREREKQRDRLFLIIITLIGLLYFELAYPEMVKHIIRQAEAGGVTVDLSAVPISIFLSVTWTILFALALRYCQSSILIERQYDYLHTVENQLAKIAGNDSMFQREGKSYLDQYPVFSNWAWIFYTMLFPAIILLVVIMALLLETEKINGPQYMFVYDSVIASGLTLTFILYRAPDMWRRLVQWMKEL